MLLHLLFRQVARFERPILVLPICPALRRLVLLRGSTASVATKPGGAGTEQNERLVEARR